MTPQLSDRLRAAMNRFGPTGEYWVPRPPTREEACAITALAQTAQSHTNYSSMRDALCEAIGIEWESLPAWNDTHTFPEVRAAFEEAIRRAEEMEATNVNP